MTSLIYGGLLVAEAHIAYSSPAFESLNVAALIAILRLFGFYRLVLLRSSL